MSNTGYAGKDNYQWWIGQVPINQFKDKFFADGSDRVQVRIIGVHDKVKIKDKDLPYAIVERPTTQGSYSRGSTGLSGGEWVRGYFLDSQNQVPVITSILGRSASSDIIDVIEVKTKGTTEFKNVSVYNADGYSAKSHRILGGPKPTAPATPTKDEFKSVKDGQDAQTKVANENLAYESATKTNATDPDSRIGSPDNPVTSSTSLTSAITSNTNQQSIRTNVAPTPEQISAANERGLRFSPFRPGSSAAQNNPGGGIFKNSTLE